MQYIHLLTKVVGVIGDFLFTVVVSFQRKLGDTCVVLKEGLLRRPRLIKEEERTGVLFLISF